MGLPTVQVKIDETSFRPPTSEARQLSRTQEWMATVFDLMNRHKPTLLDYDCFTFDTKQFPHDSFLSTAVAVLLLCTPESVNRRHAFVRDGLPHRGDVKYVILGFTDRDEFRACSTVARLGDISALNQSRAVR
jgi:hypothetical protein